MPQDKENPQPQKRVERLIFRDELTDVFNRRYLYQYLPQEISRSKSVNQNIWLFMIDIDDFKSVNDKYGHLRGDEVLKAVANVLGQCVRSEDTVIRYAGDEFTIVLPGADVVTVAAIAKKINLTVSKTLIKSAIAGQPDLSVNLSVGVASFPDDAADAVRLIDLADKALYVSKEKGKNRISFVSDISAEALRAKEILEVFPCPKLIEQENSLNSLLQNYSAISRGNKPRLVLISADVGRGKSRLLDEFVRSMEKKGGIVFLTKCSEKYLAQPYRNILFGLENLLKTVSLDKDRLLNNLTAPQLTLLAKMLAVLRQSYGLADLAAQKLSAENNELEIESGLKQLLINISSINKLSIIFDDFQWIDEATLKLVLALKKEPGAILIICALRKDSAESPETLELPVARYRDILAENSDEEIMLLPLSYLGTREMVSAIFTDMERSEKFDSLVYKITKGNPLFIEELLKFFIQKGFIYYHKGHWGKVEIEEGDVPHSLEEVILERFRSLDRMTQELISKAAVIGQDFNVELLHRLGKQDEGYVLDILESAQKAGLIKNRKASLGRSQAGDEVSFVSDEIRRVLYGLIEQDKIKDLHKQLGEIEEGLYSDNLDQIAGELFYHFKKAEDYHRAKAYANMIKDAQGLVVDRALKYAQGILEGIEEKKTAPLSKKSLELVGAIIRQLYIININSLLFPSGSSMVSQPMEDLFNKLSEIFVRDEALNFSRVKEALVVNGQRLKEGQLKKMFEESFLNFLKNNHIESITFKRGLANLEFIDFIKVLTHPAEDKSIAEELKAKGIFQIEVREISYAVASSSEKNQERERLEEAMLMDYLLSKLSGGEKAQEVNIDWDSRAEDAAEVINQMADRAVEENTPENIKEKPALKEGKKAQAVQKTFQKIGTQLLDKNPQDWDKYKKGLAKTILNLEPKLRREILLSDKPEVGLKKDIIRELSAEFPDDIVVNLLSDELKEQKVSSARMRSLVSKFLWDDEQKRRIIPQLKEKMARQGFAKEDLSWITGEQLWKDSSLEDRVKHFLGMSVQDYINLENEVDLSHLIADVLSLNRQDLFNAILDKWKEFFRVDSFGLRQRVVKSFMHIIGSIPISRPELLIILFDRVFSLLASEESLDIYALVINEVINPLGYLIDSGNFAHAKIILEGLNKERERIKGSLERSECLREAMEKIFQPDRLKLITGELIKRIDNSSYYEDIKEFVLNIGEIMVKPLMEEAMIDDKVLGYLGYFGAYLRRRGIGEILAVFISLYGPGVVAQELQGRLNDERWQVAKNAIELFTYLHDPEFVRILGGKLKHPDINIRKKVVFALNKIGGVESIGLLIEVLQDPDRELRLSTIQALARIADESVLAALKSSEQPDLRGELNTAIGAVEKLLKEKIK